MIIVFAAVAALGVPESNPDFVYWDPFLTKLSPEDTRVQTEGITPTLRSSEREGRRKRFGPPPPGYFRIVGQAVPDWTELDQFPFALRGSESVTWAPVGPKPISGEYWSGNANASGRVVDIAPHPSNADICYIASASGGVWKTVDGGNTWTPLTDELPSLNHGAVELDPSNPDIVYIGTGEITTGSTGDGVFRSLDGGQTWTRIAEASDVGFQIPDIEVDPSNPNIIHVVSSSGYHRSTNAGGSWTTVIGGACSSVEVDPSNPSNVYIGRNNSGVWKSTNSGASVTQLTTGLPSSGSVDRSLVSLCDGTPSTLYVGFSQGSSVEGLYKTTNGGTSWTRLNNTPNFANPQAWYDMFVGVDPNDPDTVYCGGVHAQYAVAGVIRSTNSGTNWTELAGTGGQREMHPDQHVIAFGPNNTVWVGNDGGVWKSTNQGDDWTNCNATLTVTQNYTIAVSPFDSNKIMGGTQDNGTVAREVDSLVWPQLIGGDGGFLAYDHERPDTRYTTYVFLDTFRFDPGFANISGPWGSDQRQFIAPLVMDPNDSDILLGGTNRIWRTTNASTSATWSPISGNIGTVNAIAVAEGDSDVIYTGSTGGQVWVTTNASNFNQRLFGTGGAIADIYINPSDHGQAYIAVNRGNGQRVRRTDNFGVNWTDVTGSLPDGVIPTALEVDWEQTPPHLYLGCGAGVYVSINGGLTWVKDGADLPNVNIGDLYIDDNTRTITAGTYGRGAFRADLPDPSVCAPITFIDQPADAEVCVGGDASFSVLTDAFNPTYVWTGPNGVVGNDATLVLGDVSFTDAGQYVCTVTNTCNSTADSFTATLTVGGVQISDQPDSQTVDVGQTAVFTVVASGDALTYTWFGPNGFIAEFSNTLTINNVSQDDAGDYVVTVSDSCGFANSDTATLTVNATADCPADVNGDGNADPADFTAWLSCFNNPASAPFCDRADVNNSGAIDPSDFTAWLAAFQAGCP